MYQNRVHLIGYLGKNPEHKSVKTTDRKYAVLSLATQRSWKGADEEWHSKTEWHRIIAWNGLGEYAAAKLRKGDHIYLEGTLVAGLRIGEILGLRWGRVHLDQCTLEVEETCYKGVFGTPKSKVSRRRTPLAPVVVQALDAHRSRCGVRTLRLTR